MEASKQNSLDVYGYRKKEKKKVRKILGMDEIQFFLFH